MKKIITLVSIFSLFALLSFSAFASAGGFVESPSAKTAPTLVDVEKENDSCTANFYITAYINRSSLSAEHKAALEAAYTSISTADDIGSLDESVEELADSLKVNSNVLSVSDLFFVGYNNCDDHDEHGKVGIIVSSVSTENFAGAMQYGEDGWEVITSYIDDEGRIVFVTDADAPIAFMVHDGSAVSGCRFPWWILLIILLLIIITAVCYYIHRRTRKS